MSERLIEFDPVTKSKSVFRDLGDDKYVIETVQDVSGALEASTAEYNAFAHKSNQKFKGDGFHHVARIPHTVLDEIYRLCQGDQHAIKEAIRQWVNNSDNAKFRTRPGKI